MTVTRKALPLIILLLLGGACAAPPHGCYEMRTCPASDLIVGGSTDGGAESADSGGSAGSAGEGDAAAGAPAGASGSAEKIRSSQADAPASEVVELPRVLSVSPSDEALGVTRDARIVIKFNHPMDPAATEAAYESSDLPASALSFSWSRGATVLTLSPRAPLEYAQRPGSVSDALAFPPRIYHYGFNARALDELGQALAPSSFTFSTLRHASVELPADSGRTGNWTIGEGEGIHNCLREPEAKYEPTVCVGDDINNVRYAGFLSFDLSTLPAGITQVTSARLLASAVVHGSPGELGVNRIEHVAYGELGEAALAVTPLSVEAPLLVATGLADEAQLALQWDVTAAVADDYLERPARPEGTQYRLSFAKVLPNNHWDDIELSTRQIALKVSYLLP